ncbi:hypothetical protein ACWC8S_11900, partial [Streptomyces fungicidicus]
MPHPHPHPSPAGRSPRSGRPVVSRRRLLESGAAVLGALALSASPGAAHAAGRRAPAGEPPGGERLWCLPARHRAPAH